MTTAGSKQRAEHSWSTPLVPVPLLLCPEEMPYLQAARMLEKKKQITKKKAERSMCAVCWPWGRFSNLEIKVSPSLPGST